LEKVRQIKIFTFSAKFGPAALSHKTASAFLFWRGGRRARHQTQGASQPVSTKIPVKKKTGKIFTIKKSVVDPDSMGFWIRIRIRNPDPDPRGHRWPRKIENS
jgi:hypothetical protein